MTQVIIECVLVAFAAGLIYGVFGGGSGLIMMPGYYYLMRHFHLVATHQMQVAVGTTAFASAILGAVAAFQQYQQGCIRFDLVKRMVLGLSAGTISAVLLLNVIPSHFLKRLFGVVVIAASIWMFSYDMDRDNSHWSLLGAWNHIRTFFIGLLWFLLGVAVFNVPYLHKCKVSLRDAVGASSFFGSAFSLLAGLLLMLAGSFTVGASINHIGYVNLFLVAVSVIPSSIASFLGARFSVYLPQALMKKIYSCLIFVVGGLMLLA